MTRAELLKPFLASFESKRPRVQRPSAGGAEGRFCVGQGHRDKKKEREFKSIRFFHSRKTKHHTVSILVAES